jgi:hypothetical protein
MEQERITKDELYRIMKLTTTYWIKYIPMTPGDIDTLVQCLQKRIDLAFDRFEYRGNFVTKEEFNRILSSANARWDRILPTHIWEKPLIHCYLYRAMREVFAESDFMKDSKKTLVTFSSSTKPSPVSSPKVSSPNKPCDLRLFENPTH